MAGSLAGGLLYEQRGLAAMIAASTVLVVVALDRCVLHPWPVRRSPGNEQEVTLRAHVR